MSKNQLQNIQNQIKELDLAIKLSEGLTEPQKQEITKQILQILINLNV